MSMPRCNDAARSRVWCHVRTVGTVKRDDVGGPLGFEDFYRTEFPSLVRALFLLVPDADEAQELAQEAMVRVYERWDRVSGMTSPGGYLYRVATNHAHAGRDPVWGSRELGLQDPNGYFLTFTQSV